MRTHRYMIEEKSMDNHHGHPCPSIFVSDLFYIMCIVMVKLVYFNFL